MPSTTDPLSPPESIPEEKRVSEILVQQSAVDDEDPSVLVYNIVQFVNALAEQGAFNSDELPLNALRCYHVDYYLAQVANGGHGQFVGNSGWDEMTIRNISDGLRAMDAGPYVEIFDDLRKFIDSNPDQAAQVAAGRGFGDQVPAIEALDDRFLAGDCHKTITPANARWVRGLPELRVVPDSEFADAMYALCTSNPLREKRLSERKNAALESALTDPLRVAAGLLCTQARTLPITGYGGGDPSAVSPDGRQGMGWHISTPHGRRVVFMFDDIAYLCVPQLADGRDLTDEVMEEGRRQLEEQDVEGMTGWHPLSYREVARIDSADIVKAIDLAKSRPVAAFARALLAKLDESEVLTDIFAAGKFQSDNWRWMVVTDRRAARLEIGIDKVTLSDVKERCLCTLSAGEIGQILGSTSSSPKPDVSSGREGSFLDEYLVSIVQKHAQIYLSFGFFAALLVYYLATADEVTWTIGLLAPAALLVFAKRLWDITKTHRTLVESKGSSADLSWFSQQTTPFRLALLTALGALLSLSLIHTAFALSDLLKLKFGAVPSVSVFGYQIYVTVIFAMTLLAALILAHRFGTRFWARRKVAARKGMTA